MNKAYLDPLKTSSCEDEDDEPPGTRTYTVRAPRDAGFSVTRESNNTRTIRLTNSYGADIVTINVGVALMCAAFGGGIGLTVASFTVNPTLGWVVGKLTFAGCSAIMADSWEDGDEYKEEDC